MKNIFAFLKSKLSAIHDFLAANPAIDTPLALYFGVVALDWISSILCWATNSGAHESNPFARNVAMNFVLRKGMAIDAIYFVAVAAICYAGYKAISAFREDVAKMAVGLFLVYTAMDRLLSAVVPNFLYALHMYVADPTPVSLFSFLNR